MRLHATLAEFRGRARVVTDSSVLPFAAIGLAGDVFPAISRMAAVASVPAPDPHHAPPRFQAAVPQPVMTLLRGQHDRHLSAARLCDHPAPGAYAMVPDLDGRDWHMDQAATIRRAVAEAGDTEEAVALSAAETAVRAAFRGTH